MTRSFPSLRAALCATGLFVLAAGGASAQTLPTTTTPATDFTLPTVCQPTSGENHGEEMRACIRALRAELAQNGDDHQGLGQWVSAAARDNGQGQHDGDTDDDTGSTSTTSSSTSAGATTPTTPSSSTASTSTSVTAQSTPTPHDAQPHGHKHGDN
jgi:hypothetical protein